MNFKAAIKYVVILAVTGFLLWVALNNIHVEEGETKLGFITKVWSTANKPFLLLSGMVALLSHMIRAERWRILLAPVNHTISFGNSFLSVMVGYFVNLVIPRGGEVSRCYNIFRLEKVPINVSLGTVISERVVDLIFLLTLISLSFFIELDVLVSFFKTIDLDGGRANGLRVLVALGVGGLLLLALLFVGFKVMYAYRKRLVLKLYAKVKALVLGIKEGVQVIFKLEKRALFIFYSISIWVCYYLMSYFVMMAFPDTSSLTLLAALTIFVIGGIAMTVPLPGGTGSYHVLVPAGLVFLYGIAENNAFAFTVIFHAWHTLIIIVVGATSMLISQSRAKYKLNGKNRA